LKERIIGTGEKTRRGWGWIAVQAVIFALILWAPPLMRLPLPSVLRWLGPVLILAGGLLGSGGVLALGDTLSVFPEPKAGGRLVLSGVYALVRHPIYGGLILATLGLALWRRSLTGILLALLLLIFFDLKSRYEERELKKSFPTYADYRRQVGKRMLPWLY
jgi:protein-S-isoprenylcysteine O-methyltransferase Ste14